MAKDDDAPSRRSPSTTEASLGNLFIAIGVFGFTSTMIGALSGASMYLLVTSTIGSIFLVVRGIYLVTRQERDQ